MESQDILEKIRDYETQRQQVREYLQSDPTNEQFLQLDADLDKAIKLTKNLLEAQTRDDDDVDDSDEDEDTAFVKAILPQKTGELQVHDIIEVIGNDRPYAGVIQSIDKSADSCTIKYFEYASADVTLPLSSITRIPPGVFTQAEITVGLKCMCKYSQDQKFYEAEVTEILPHGVKVMFTEYGNSEEVPIQYILPVKTSNKKRKKDGDAPMGSEKGLIPIPEKLKILPTDTEEEKMRKKKKLKAIKNHNRKVSAELEMQETQHSWQKFVKKGAKKPFSGITKQSIFATTEDVEGKVGVVNSGKGLTDFGQRKKFRFEPLP